MSTIFITFVNSKVLQVLQKFIHCLLRKGKMCKPIRAIIQYQYSTFHEIHFNTLQLVLS